MDILSAIEELFAFIFPFLERFIVIRALLGIMLVFLLPGFAWSLVFFKGKKINLIERLGLSIGLSIALVTLSIFALNVLFGFKITGFNSAIVIITITAIPLTFYYLDKYFGERLRENLSKFLQRD